MARTLLLLLCLLGTHSFNDEEPLSAAPEGATDEQFAVTGSDDTVALALLEEQEAARAYAVYDFPSNNETAVDSLLQGTSSRVAWRGRFDPQYQLGYFAPYILYSSRPPAQYRTVAVDPTNPASRQPVLKVTYPAGSWSPSASVPGGTLFYTYPYGQGSPIAYLGATLEYDVYFPPDFQFVKGGKLPGLAGGPHGCGGGVDPLRCWSVRVMWRREGDGEAYMYVPEGRQGADFCSQPPYTICDYAKGVSLSRGAFRFVPGVWHRLALTVRMNDVGVPNGVVEIAVDGRRRVYYDKLCYRTVPGVQVDSIYFATWFGGGDSSWGPSAETYALFKNIRIYRADPPTGRPLGPQSVIKQTTVTAPLQDLEPQN